MDGLVHISQVANRRIQRVEDELAIGQEVDVKVLDASSENRRISLSIRELLPEEKQNQNRPNLKQKRSNSKKKI